jgi:protein disulfide-isomerase A1
LEGEITEKNIKKFVTSQSLPLVVEFNHETAQKIFGGDIKSHLLMFLSQQDGHVDKYIEGAREVAKEFREKVFAHILNYLYTIVILINKYSMVGVLATLK